MLNNPIILHSPIEKLAQELSSHVRANGEAAEKEVARCLDIRHSERASQRLVDEPGISHSIERS